MKLLSHPAVTALGITAIISTSWLAPVSSDLHQTIFKMGGSLSAVLVPLFTVIASIWFFWFLVLIFSRRNSTASLCIGIILTLVVIRELIEDVYALTSPDLSSSVVFPPHWVNVFCKFFFIILAIALLILSRRAPHIMNQAKTFGLTVLAFTALSGGFTLARDVVYAWEGRNLNAPQPLHQYVASTKPGQHRIVWILFDELSYRQIYEHRYPDLKLPAFDKLAQESDVFTDVRPAGKYTVNVIPSLLSGVPDDKIRAEAAGKPLWVRNSDTGRWQQFNPNQTVFQDALNAGYSTAVAGWVIPYCRLLSAQLDHCFASLGGSWLPISNQATIVQNMRPAFFTPIELRLGNGKLRNLWNRFFLPAQVAPAKPIPPSTDGIEPNPSEGQARAYEDIRAVSDAYLRDSSINFIYIHLDTPHPLGFFNRHTGRFDTSGTYIDNLALCDRFLADVRSNLEAEGDWDNTTLIIMGDHSWRTYEWDKERWTPEDQKASDGGKFDDRPGYIVKLAGQTTPAHIDTPYQAIRTRSLVDNLIQNKITTPGQLAAWVDK